MPTYEYRCTNGHQYETREGFDAPARQECPTCGAQAKRVLFPPPIVFKGSGFYITDSRKGSSATVTSDGPSSSSSSSSSSDSSSSTPKADSAPAPAASSSDD
ncbi:MAG: FmdB family zinc ribbon protein [Dehalococcoidia bacterium]